LRTIRKSSIALAAVVGAGGLFLSDHFSTTAPRTYLSQAEAVIGRPLTPLSVAGVARRTTRRAVAAGAIGYGAYAVGRYGYPYNYGYTNYSSRYPYSNYGSNYPYSNYRYANYFAEAASPGYYRHYVLGGYYIHPYWQGEPTDRLPIWRYGYYQGSDPDNFIRLQLMRDPPIPMR
jgi:hypothetical protein